MMLPAVLDPWAACALYEAANLAAKHPGSKVWLVSLGPKAKLQQVMMTVAQKVPFELVAVDGPLGGFTDASPTAAALAEAIAAIPGLDRGRLLLFGGWESASRGAGVTMQVRASGLGITDQFQGVDQITVAKTDRSRCWSGWKAASTRFPSARAHRRCWDGRPAICRSRATVRRLGWRTCAALCLRAESEEHKAGRQRVELRFREPAQATARDAHGEGYAGRRNRARNRAMDCGVSHGKTSCIDPCG